MRLKNVPEDIIDIVGKCASEEEGDRPQSASVLQKRLSQFVQASPKQDYTLDQSQRGQANLVGEEFDISIPGWWYARKANRPESDWRMVCETPALVTTFGNEEYRFAVKSSCTIREFGKLNDLSQIKRIKSLDISRCKALTDNVLRHLAGFIQIESLSLKECELVTDNGLRHLSVLHNFNSLNLSGCAEITDIGLDYIGSLVKIRILDLMGCDHIGDSGLASLANYQDLRSLALSGELITDLGLKYLAVHKSLKSLMLCGCEGVTDTGLLHLSDLKNLSSFDQSCCKRITVAGISRFMRQHPRCKLDGLYSVWED